MAGRKKVPAIILLIDSNLMDDLVLAKNKKLRRRVEKKLHQSLDNLTPDEVYYLLPHLFAEAA